MGHGSYIVGNGFVFNGPWVMSHGTDGRTEVLTGQRKAGNRTHNQLITNPTPNHYNAAVPKAWNSLPVTARDHRAGGRPPRTLRSGGGPHACSGASCCVGELFWAHQNAKNLLVAGAPPRTPLGELIALPQTPSWWGGAPRGLCCPSPRTPLTILSLCLSCVYVHTCIKMHCYFLLNVKHGASQLYWGGASNYLAPALRDQAYKCKLS